MPEKNQELTGVVEALASQGEGIVKVQGVTFFVPFTLIGEKIRFKVLKIKDGIGYGKCIEVLSPSEARVLPRCEVFGKCGGCQLQHMTYIRQLEFKREQVKNTLKKVGNIEYDVPMPEASEREYAYRNKLQLPVGTDREGNTVIGFYAGHSHRIVPIRSCPIHPDWVAPLIRALYDYMGASGVKGYDEEKRTGNLRHIVIRDMGGRFIVALVSKTEKLPKLNRLIEGLKNVFAEFTLVLNVNDKDTNVIFGDKFTTLYGSGFFEAEEFGITFEAGAQTFVQINGDIRSKLYERALSEIAATGEEVVVDCYSGAGLMTAMAAKKAKRAYGIEMEPQASLCAERLREKNGLSNMRNICGKVEDVLPSVLQTEKGEEIRLILDPPRAGIHRSVLNAILQSGIEKAVLISCNPATLARDLGLLTGTLTEGENGQLVKADASGAYNITFLQPYDMFPQTKHVETLVTLFHKKPDSHIEVTVDFANGKIKKDDIIKRAEGG